MKAAISLNESGKKRAIEFLKKYDKRFDLNTYNLKYALEEIEQKALGNDNYHYELGGFDTANGIPQTISFLDSELTFEDVE